jgi:hypothetical protein
MSLFRSKTPNDATLEYESWSPAATADRAAAQKVADVPATRKSGRSRTQAEHLASAVEALEAAAVRRT